MFFYIVCFYDVIYCFAYVLIIFRKFKKHQIENFTTSWRWSRCISIEGRWKVQLVMIWLKYKTDFPRKRKLMPSYYNSVSRPFFSVVFISCSTLPKCIHGLKVFNYQRTICEREMTLFTAPITRWVSQWQNIRLDMYLL